MFNVFSGKVVTQYTLIVAARALSLKITLTNQEKGLVQMPHVDWSMMQMPHADCLVLQWSHVDWSLLQITNAVR